MHQTFEDPSPNSDFNNCQHQGWWFLPWHRMYLRQFEKIICQLIDQPQWRLPYWDYTSGTLEMPEEFLNPANKKNPLWAQRDSSGVSTDDVGPDAQHPIWVADAFASANSIDFGSTSITTPENHAQGGHNGALERMHNLVHGDVGGTMADPRTAAADPIFWLHHANIDRLNNAWVAAGAGRAMPPSTDPYWNGLLVDANSRAWQGVFKYSDSAALPAKFNLAVRSCIDTRANFGYFYDNEKLPTGTPAAAPALGQGGTVSSALARQVAEPAAPRPAVQVGKFAVSGMRQTGANRLALGGALDIVLGNQSVAADVVLAGAAVQALQSVLDSFQASPFSPLLVGGLQYKTVKVILSNVTMTDSGAQGGYYYNLNLTVPSAQGKGEDTYSFGNVGPFRIAGRQHHEHTQMGVEIDIDITDLMLKRGRPNLGQYRFTLDRVSGSNAPYGDVIKIGELRLELA
jgi:tyrosinase